MVGVFRAVSGFMDMVERIPKGWLPPHCTNPKCKYHKHMGGSWPVRKAGFYTRQSDRRSVQRFHCRACGVTMSTQSFSTTYWQKRPELTQAVFLKSVKLRANSPSPRRPSIAISPGSVGIASCSTP